MCNDLILPGYRQLFFGRPHQEAVKWESDSDSDETDDEDLMV